MRRRPPCALLLAFVVVLAGCSGGDPPAAADLAIGGDVPAAADAPPADEVAATTTIIAAGQELKAEIYPLVRSGEHVVATIDVTPTKPLGDSRWLSYLFEAPNLATSGAVPAVRLFDLRAERVHVAARDAEGNVVGNLDDDLRLEPEGIRVQAAFAAPAPDTATLGVLLPAARYVESVPVVDGEVPPPNRPGTGDAPETTSTTRRDGASVEPIDLAAIVEAKISPLESYTEELDGAVTTLQSTERVQVTLGADVLFATDQDTLSPAAEAVLDAAVEQLQRRAAGTIDVVGHTDDVGADAYNQDLSERRAASVAAALARRIDAARYPLKPAGRGEREPVVANDSDGNRARNRRVTLTLVSDVTAADTTLDAAALPEFDGPIATGVDGVEHNPGRPWRVRAPKARRVDGNVVVDLEITPLDNEVDSSFGVGFLSGGVWSHPRGKDAHDLTHAASNVTVVRGRTAYYPLDHAYEVADDGKTLWLPAADLYTVSRVDGGQTRTYSVIFPDLGPVDEVTVQVDDVFRLTDIPVA